MKTQNGFTLLNKNEIGPYLAKQKVTRKITRLQVHQMFLPNYSTWEKTDKKSFPSLTLVELNHLMIMVEEHGAAVQVMDMGII